MRTTTTLNLLAVVSALSLQSCSDRIMVPQINFPVNHGKIAYFKMDYSATTAYPPNEVLLDSAGQNPSLLLEGGMVFASAGGKMLYAVPDTATKDLGLSVANNNGSGRVKIQLPDTLGFEGYGDVSADGQHIALPLSGTASNNLLFLMDLNGGSPRLLSNKLAHESRPKFSNKGDKVAFYTTDRIGNAISVFNLVNSTMVTVARPVGSFLPDGIETISWSHDDSKISYIVNSGTSNEVHVLNVDGSADIAIPNCISAAWSPTADILAYGDENGAVHILTEASPEDVYSSTTEGSRVWDWTLDGKKIVCETWSGDYDHSTVSIELIDPTTRSREVLATPGIWPVVLR